MGISAAVDRRLIINMLNDYDKYITIGRIDMVDSVFQSRRRTCNRWHDVQFKTNLISTAAGAVTSEGVSFGYSQIRGRHIGSGMEYRPGQKPRYFDIYDRNGVLYREY